MAAFSVFSSRTGRQPGIDALRGLAVLLVICRHWNINNFLGHAGWMGVDLFFVISGFLVSGLLFSEYEKHRKLNFIRFFIRRGFKIYPLLYALIGITVLIQYLYQVPFSYKNVLAELLFVQNYFAGLYMHTWSLAIEEHFYIVLMLLFIFLSVRAEMNGKQLPVWVIGIMCAVICLRFLLCYLNEPGIYFTTHTRIDSLFAGVLVQYVFRYKKNRIGFYQTKVRYAILFASLFCLSTFGFSEPNNVYTQSFGFTLIYLSFSAILLYVLTTSSDIGKIIPLKLLAFGGFYSYGIYLVHIPMLHILQHFGIEETYGLRNAVYFILYALLSAGAGILFSELVEQPMLRVRNRFFPSRASASAYKK
jgi:peptidoglycan/LPS O-acetylase OafA/YrhL